MKAEKVRAFIKYSFPKKLFTIPSVDTEMISVYIDTLMKELDELERLAKIAKEIEEGNAEFEEMISKLNTDSTQ